MDKIQGWTEIFPQKDFLRQTRAYRLEGFASSASVWIKREDETSFGIPGNKLRKYASLIPCLESANIKEVALIGGAYSNHVAALPQLLIEKGIHVSVFLRGEPELKPVGNLALIQFLLPPERIHWVSRKDWSDVESFVQQYIQENSPYPHASLCIREGAFMPESLVGSMTLGADIRRNETDLGVFFSHIWIDAGTGLSAMSAMLEDFPHSSHRQWHILLNAGTEEGFLREFMRVKGWYQELFPEKEIPFGNFRLYMPSGDRFGKITPEILRATQFLARKYGLLMDPAYGVKLWLRMQEFMALEKPEGNILIIHSGGNGLWGNMEKLIQLSFKP